MEQRITIRLNEETIRILEDVKRVWPEHAASQSALIRTIISDWYRYRSENGSKSQKIVDRIDLAENRIIAAIEERSTYVAIAVIDELAPAPDYSQCDNPPDAVTLADYTAGMVE